MKTGDIMWDTPAVRVNSDILYGNTYHPRVNLLSNIQNVRMRTGSKIVIRCAIRFCILLLDGVRNERSYTNSAIGRKTPGSFVNTSNDEAMIYPMIFWEK